MLKGPNLDKIFVLSASLAAAQLWLIVVFTSSLAWSISRPCLSRLDATRIYDLWLIVVCAVRTIARGVSIQLKMLSKSSQRWSRRLDMAAVFRGGRITTSVFLTRCSSHVSFCFETVLSARLANEQDL
jgi:hypothetical protein